MTIDYFFPFFKEDDAKTCLENFKKSEFYKNNKEGRFVFVCNKNDENNFKYLSSISDNKNKLLLLDNDFTYNDAFYYSINYFQADIILLADGKIARLDILFKKCLEKYMKKANVVHIIKRAKGIKGFFIRTFQKFYNMMIKMFTGKKDRCNIISLGLIDKHVIDVLKVLPNKCCFLKNTKNLHGFESRSIYVDDKTKTYKLNFKKLTPCLKMAYGFLGVSCGLVISLILINSLIKTNVSVYNIITITAVIVCIFSTLIVMPKHYFDIRNSVNRNVDFKIIEYEVKQEKEEKLKKSKSPKTIKKQEENKKEKKSKQVKKQTINSDKKVTNNNKNQINKK